jgi:hypothetical protein
MRAGFMLVQEKVGRAGQPPHALSFVGRRPACSEMEECQNEDLFSVATEGRIQVILVRECFSLAPRSCSNSPNVHAFICSTGAPDWVLGVSSPCELL